MISKISQTKKDKIPFDFTYMESKSKIKKKIQLINHSNKSRIRPINTENKLMVARWWVMDKMGEDELEIQAFSYGIYKS